MRLVDRKPEESDCMSGSKRASPVQCCVTASISTRTAFGLPLPHSASLVGSVPPVVDAAPPLPHRFECLPARDHCGGSDPRKGEGNGDVLPATLYPAQWRTSAENQGRSLHHLPIPCGTTTRHARRGRGGQHRTAHYRRGLGESMPTRDQCGFPGTAWTTTARASPSDSADLQLSKSCTTYVRHPRCSRVTHTTPRP